MVQFAGSVDTGVAPNVTTSGGMRGPANEQLLNIIGTYVDTGPTCFPTVPSSFDANSHYYPGLARSYLGASEVETPSHRQIRFETRDINSVQLNIRGPISPQVLLQWQLSQTLAANNLALS